MRRFAALFLLVLALGFAPAPFPRPERRTKVDRAIEGLWQGQSRLLITSNRLIYSPGPERYEYALQIDPSARPAAYEIRGVAGTNAAGAVFYGIYRVEGDTLTLCYNGDPRPRPTAFEGPGKGMFTEVYTRIKQ